jgi:hypothetical protein
LDHQDTVDCYWLLRQWRKRAEQDMCMKLGGKWNAIQHQENMARIKSALDLIGHKLQQNGPLCTED